MILTRKADDSVFQEDSLLNAKMSLLDSYRGSENFRFISSLSSAGRKGSQTNSLPTEELTSRIDSHRDGQLTPYALHVGTSGHLPSFNNFTTQASSFNKQVSRGTDQKGQGSTLSLVKVDAADLSQELRQDLSSIDLSDFSPSKISLHHQSLSEATGKVLYRQLSSAANPI